MQVKYLQIKLKDHWELILNFVIIFFLLVLPYYLFEGKLFLGGDDTRLFYSFPFDFLKNVTYFSWYNLSSIGINVSNQYFLPFLSIWSLLDWLIKNKMALSYLGFSLPIIFGYVYFKKFVKELFSLEYIYHTELTIGAVCYILSPIIIINQFFVFLTSVWLLGLFPAIGFYFLRYLKSGEFKNIYIATLFSFLFSFAILTIPWLLGFIVPILFGLIILASFSKKKELLYFLKRSLVFSTFIIGSQAFWLLGFLAPYVVQDKNSFAYKFQSKEFLDTFSATIHATATGHIIYPLMNMFHRQIAFDFNWKLKSEFINLFDKIFLLNAFYVIILAIGLYSYKKYFDKKNRVYFLFIFSSFLVSLYLFTVNIGPLKDLFLALGKVPGFIMFRNFYDKFAPGYVFLFSILLTLSLVLAKKRYTYGHVWLEGILVLIVLLNFSSAKSTVNSPLWTTENVYKTINVPKEYLDFMKAVKDEISSTNTILSIPFGASTYTVIKDEGTDNVYVGVSPVKIFSGVNDISGNLSFLFSKEAAVVDKIITDRKYQEFNNILYAHNINYVLVTKNIPQQVLRSYAFNQFTLPMQDKEFLAEITNKKVLKSNGGNYELYTTKKKNILISSHNLYFKKINAVKYKLYLKNIRTSQDLTFIDSFHKDWKLYVKKKPDLSFCSGTKDTKIKNTTECKSQFSFFELSEMSYLWTRSVFDASHTTIDGNTNMWRIDPNVIRNRYGSDYIKPNSDGSMDIEFIMYFKPQLYMYYGLLISILTIFIATSYFIFEKRYKK